MQPFTCFEPMLVPVPQCLCLYTNVSSSKMTKSDTSLSVYVSRDRNAFVAQFDLMFSLNLAIKRTIAAN